MSGWRFFYGWCVGRVVNMRWVGGHWYYLQSPKRSIVGRRGLGKTVAIMLAPEGAVSVIGRLGKNPNPAAVFKAPEEESFGGSIIDGVEKNPTAVFEAPKEQSFGATLVIDGAVGVAILIFSEAHSIVFDLKAKAPKGLDAAAGIRNVVVSWWAPSSNNLGLVRTTNQFEGGSYQ